MGEKFTYTSGDIVGFAKTMEEKLALMPDTVNAYFKGLISNETLGEVVKDVMMQAKLAESGKDTPDIPMLDIGAVSVKGKC